VSGSGGIGLNSHPAESALLAAQVIFTAKILDLAMGAVGGGRDLSLLNSRVGLTCSRMSIETLRKLPRQEKLKLMEALWEDLRIPDSEFESPIWHAKELAKTEQRLAEGKEEVLDWEEGKRTLRDRFR